MAKQLVDAISRPFDPNDEEYRDTYRDDVLALIRRKAEGGEVAAAPPESEAGPSAAAPVDIVAL